MKTIEEHLEEFQDATLGRDVKQGLIDCIRKCYEDATGNPESVANVVKENKTIKERLQSAVDTLNARISNIIANDATTDGNSELIDLRIDDTGGVFDVAGDMVRTMISRLKAAVNSAITLDKLDLNRKNIYKSVGEIFMRTYCYGYDKSTLEPVMGTELNYDVWVANIQDLEKYESITIPLEESYDTKYDATPVLLLGPENATRYTTDGIKNMPLAVYNEEEKTITLSVKSLMWFLNNRGCTKIYVTKKADRNFIYAPKKFNAVEYIEDRSLSQSKMQLNERVVAYSQVRVVEGGAITLFADNALYGNSTSKYAAVNFEVTGISGYELRDAAIIIYGDGVDDEGGSVTITYCKEDAETPTLSKTIAVYKYAADYGSGKTRNIICIGDSYTYGAEAVDFMLQYFEADGTMNVNVLGTSPGREEGETFGSSTFHSNVNIKDAEGNVISTVPFISYWAEHRSNPPASDIASYRVIPANEGRGGWAPYSYVTKQEFNGSGNAFLNEKGVFDFSYYVEKNGYSDIDMVLLCLGTNSVTVAIDGIYPTLEQDAAAWQEIIDSIHAYDKNIIIGIWLANPPSQLNGSHMIKEKDLRLEVIDQLNNRYSGSYSENIYLIPTGISVNTIDGFPTGEYYQSGTYGGGGRYVDDVNWKKEKYCTNELHPNGYGYMQIGYVLYAWIKSLAYK